MNTTFESELVVKPVDKTNWSDFQSFFESKGCPHNCWCMVWRNMKKGTVRSKKADKKISFKNYINKEIPVGLLCYADSQPVAWCSVAPRDSYRELSGDSSLTNVWSIVCFFITKKYRKQGMIRFMIKEAIKYAEANGAKYVEAYPVDTESPSYRFMGFRTTFDELGFVFRHKAGERRYVMTLKL